VHAGSNRPAARWAPERFAEVAASLAASGRRIVLTGGRAEQELTGHLATRIPGAADVGGRTDLDTLGWLLCGADLLISNDTGVSHIASALKLPSIILFRASDMQRWAPGDRRLHRCIWDPEGLQTDTVLAQARALLAARAEIVR